MTSEEILKDQYALNLADSTVTNLANSVLRSIGFDKTMIFQVTEDPARLFLLANRINSIYYEWEVHHATVINGEFKFSEWPTDLKSIATSLGLYKIRIDKGHGIRVICRANMWPVYSTVIDQLQPRDRLVMGEIINFSSSSGTALKSQFSRKRGTFERLNQPDSPFKLISGIKIINQPK